MGLSCRIGGRTCFRGRVRGRMGLRGRARGQLVGKNIDYYYALIKNRHFSVLAMVTAAE